MRVGIRVQANVWGFAEWGSEDSASGLVGVALARDTEPPGRSRWSLGDEP